MSDLGTLANDKTTGQSFAYGVNAAGDVVVGQVDNGTAQHAFRWTQASGMSDLGTLASDKTTGASVAYGVNAAGDVVVGQAYNGTTNQAFRWTSANGMQSIEAWLTANGVTVNAAAPKTSIAYGVNAAGDVVVGILANNHAFIATTKGSTTESQTTKGLLDLVENQKSLAGASGTPSHAIQDASLVMHGAHGSPMRGLLTAGKQDFWLAGDWGQRENQGNAGNLGAGEIGYARGVGDQVMVKLALGRTYSKQDTVFGGNTRVDGTYIMPEIIAKLSGTPLYATFSAYYNWSDTEVTRGYDNAGTREYGRGSADVNTAAVRARLDWLDAITAGKTSFTPYASVTDTRSRVGAYRETGGAFPASWNSRTEHSTESRLGLDAVHRVGDQLNVLGRLEGVHQFNNTGAAASGDVAGLYGFSLPGQTYKRDWLRAAIGFEGKMGAGTGTLMLNASTQSDATTYWVAASYRMAF
jgi:probable HAF family extracellular repeat protein